MAMLDLFGAQTNKKVGIICSDDPDGRGWYSLFGPALKKAGYAVKTLQEYPALAEIPVIVLTARDPENNEKRTLESGAVAFFQKPADNEELLAVIRASLQAGGGWGGRPSS